MKLLFKYKNIEEGQIVKNQGDLAIVRYIVINEVLEEKYLEGDYAMVRITLVNKNGIPFADTTQSYKLIELL